MTEMSGYDVTPLARELPADTWTPVAAFLRLAGDGRRPSFLLESVEGGEHLSRYSFLGSRPFETLVVKGGRVLARREDGGTVELPGNPFMALGERLALYRAARDSSLPRFAGGAVGILGYEMVRHIEPSVRLALPEGPEAELHIFRDVVAFDHARHRMLLIANAVAGAGTSAAGARRRACDALDEMESLLKRPAKAAPAWSPQSLVREDPTAERTARLKLSLDAGAYMRGVAALKRHIRAGDILQGVLSTRFERPVSAAPFSVYRALRRINPSPYMFFIGTRYEAVLGASPEMLVRVEDGGVETRPIAGTRPRGRTEEEDARLERSLLASVKERAEHVMLVDLGRNDVGRVAAPGSVCVPSYMAVERYSHVMHLVSSVRCRLRRGVSPWEALAACFPAGTVTGAPKIRAMQLLAEIEPVPRGLYAGAVVYRDFGGNLDSAIAIRGMSVRGGVARFQAGAGIVADSSPIREHAEALDKSKAMAEAIRLAQA